MPRVRVPIIGGHYKGRSLNLNAQETINFYPVLDREGKYEKALIGTPGLIEFADLGSTVQVRRMLPLGSTLYGVGGDSFYSMDTSGNVTTVTASVLSSTTGPVYMEHDGTNIMVVDPGVDGYTYSGAGDLTVIGDADFPTPSSLTWQDGYFIVGKDGTGAFYISTAYDPTAWDATDYAVAEADPDNLQRVFMDHLNLWLIGKKTTEPFYNSGASAFPFDRISGAVIEEGTDSPASVAAGDGAVFWLTNTLKVVRADGFSPTIISDANLEYQISTYSSVTDAIGFCYTEQGHTFYFLIFPTGNATWVYDCATKRWHKRQSFPKLATGWGRHRANCYAYFNGKHLVGDWNNGKIYEMDMDTYTDAGETIRRVRVTQATHVNGLAIFIPRLEVDVEAGVGLVTGQGSDPQMMLSSSRDGGHIYGNEHWRAVGKIGEYSARAAWNRLGRSHDWRWKWAVSDPVKWVIMAAHADIEMGSS